MARIRNTANVKNKASKHVTKETEELLKMIPSIIEGLGVEILK